MDYVKDIAIDPSALDAEWLGQAALMLKYAQHASEMRRLMDEAKENVDVKYAEINKHIRLNPAEFQIEKITESIVQSTIALQSDYQEVIKIYNDAKYEADMAKAAVIAIDQRKTALENLVKLHGMQYFAGPTEPRDLTKEWRNKQNEKESNKRVNKAMKQGKQP